MEKTAEELNIKRNHDGSFTLIIGNIHYKLKINNTLNSLDLSCKLILSQSYYEAIFTMDDFKSLSPCFYSFDNLDDVYNFFIEKFTKNEFEFQIDDKIINFKFLLPVGIKFKEVNIVLNKGTHQDTSIIIDEMSIAINRLSDNFYESNKKYNYLEEKLQESKNETMKRFEEIQELQMDMMKRFEEKLQELQNEMIKRFEQIQKEQTELKLVLYKQDEKQILTDKKLQALMPNPDSLSSRIIQPVEVSMLLNWLKESNYNPKTFKLLYRATEHGKSAKEFHSRCDNQGPTISFIKTTNNKRFGGFTSISWDSSNNYKSYDNHAFIFSLDKAKKLTCNEQSYVIYCNSSYGITYGGGHDINISNAFDASSYTNCPYSYGKNEGISSFYLIDNTQSYHFTPEEVEVFLVERI